MGLGINLVGSILYGLFYATRLAILGLPEYFLSHTFEAFFRAVPTSFLPSIMACALLATWLVADSSREQLSIKRGLWKGLLLGFLSDVLTFFFSLVGYFISSLYRILSVENLILFNIVGCIISCIGGMLMGLTLAAIASRYLSLNDQGTEADKVKNQVV